MNIVIADDDETFLLMVSAAVRKLGHLPVACDSGRKAWKELEGAYYPVLITDWTMPELDGMLLTRMLRAATPHHAYTYVVMLTAHGRREDYASAIHAGVDAFLVKPLDQALLDAQLRIAEHIVNLENHARRLESLLVMCSYCKNVQADDGRWIPVEQYMNSRLHALSSHSICPTCLTQRVEPEMRRLGI